MSEINSILFAKAMADETRQKIMGTLCCAWLCVNDIVTHLDGQVTQPTVSHHLSILRDHVPLDRNPPQDRLETGSWDRFSPGGDLDHDSLRTRFCKSPVLDRARFHRRAERFRLAG